MSNDSRRNFLKGAALGMTPLALSYSTQSNAVVLNENEYKTVETTGDLFLLDATGVKYAKTLGFLSPKDGGGSIYIWRPASGQDIDDIIVFDSKNDGVWVFYENFNVTNVNKLGCLPGRDSAENLNAIERALELSDSIFVPAGRYAFSNTIILAGEKVIFGESASSTKYVKTSFVFEHHGNGIEITDKTYSGVHIAHLKISSGSIVDKIGNPYFAIKSYRPNSTFTNIYILNFDGSGISLSTHPVPDANGRESTTSSWNNRIRDCEYETSIKLTNYRGLDIDVNGGNIEVASFRCTGGDIGININRGEDISISQPSITQCNHTYGLANKAAIRLSGEKLKKAIRIFGGYLENYTHGVYVEQVSALSISNVYMADAGNGGANAKAIYLKDENVKGVEISNNYLRVKMGEGVEIGPAVDGVVLSQNQVSDSDGISISPNVHSDTNITEFIGDKLKGKVQKSVEQIDVGSGASLDLSEFHANKTLIVRSSSGYGAQAEFNLPHLVVGSHFTISKTENSKYSNLVLNAPPGKHIDGFGSSLKCTAEKLGSITLVSHDHGLVPVAMIGDWESN